MVKKLNNALINKEKNEEQLVNKFVIQQLSKESLFLVEKQRIMAL